MPSSPDSHLHRPNTVAQRRLQWVQGVVAEASGGQPSRPGGWLRLLRLALTMIVGERLQALSRYYLDQVAHSNERLTMGRGSYGGPQILTFPGDTASVRVGQFSSIGMDVVLMDGGNHRSDWVTTYPLRSMLRLPGAFEDGHPKSKGDIAIGNDVWIGRGARVLSGVTIGDGAVVAGYSVVTKDVRPYAVVAGNPAREVRRRFDDDQVEALLEIAWWDWPLERIRAVADELSAPEIDAFIARHRTRAAASA